jgi:hypothetical protein
MQTVAVKLNKLGDYQLWLSSRNATATRDYTIEHRDNQQVILGFYTPALYEQFCNKFHMHR